MATDQSNSSGGMNTASAPPPRPAAGDVPRVSADESAAASALAFLASAAMSHSPVPPQPGHGHGHGYAGHGQYASAAAHADAAHADDVAAAAHAAHAAAGTAAVTPSPVPPKRLHSAANDAAQQLELATALTWSKPQPPDSTGSAADATGFANADPASHPFWAGNAAASSNATGFIALGTAPASASVWAKAKSKLTTAGPRAIPKAGLRSNPTPSHKKQLQGETEDAFANIAKARPAPPKAKAKPKAKAAVKPPPAKKAAPAKKRAPPVKQHKRFGTKYVNVGLQLAPTLSLAASSGGDLSDGMSLPAGAGAAAAGTVWPLGRPTDAQYLSPTACLLRRQIEVFAATYEETLDRGKRHRPPPGAVGIRCVHCKHVPYVERARGAVTYPSSVRLMYQAARNFQRYVHGVYNIWNE